MPLFEQVGEAVHSMAPPELGELKMRAHRRGLKVWFDTAKPSKEHFEAQVLPRRYVDGRDGMTIEIGFHAEHRDPAMNTDVIARLTKAEKKWRRQLGSEAEIGVFFGAASWRRISEVWIEPDLDDPDLAFEMAARLVDYLTAIEPAR